ncbi:MAG: Initiator Replication protein [Candidatus Dependentiae bacterium ADurb.Bin246]|nr:MAG: Initiator Replication protein [Candidatus Dependentiae bacterium ADurb.Bin246]
MVTDLTNAKDNWIFVENRFIEASYSFTPEEQKVIRILASMVRKDDEEFKEYKFKVLELAEFLEINKKNAYRDLEKVSGLLMSRYIKVRNKDKPNKWELFHVINKAKCEDGFLTLKIDNEMKPFYLALEEFTKYQLKNIVQFKHKHTFRIYELLKQYEHNKKIKERIIPITDLRTYLDISDNEYKVYSDFKKRVLITSQNEINSKTDISFEFEQIKGVRAVESIKFKIISNPDKEEPKQLDGQIQIDIEYHKFNTLARLFYEETGVEFPVNDLKELVEQKGYNVVRDYFLNAKKFNYKSPVGFFIKAIKESYKIPEQMRNPQKNKVPQQSNFEQRKYEKGFLDSLYDNF